MRATTSVRRVFTFSVIPSDSIMIRYAPASMNRLACWMVQSTARVAIGLRPPVRDAGCQGRTAAVVDLVPHHPDDPRIECADRTAERVEHARLEGLACTLRQGFIAGMRREGR